jgi:hypothetical protein
MFSLSMYLTRHQSCAPCVESCTWFCEHRGNCEIPCAAPCSRLPCNQRCSKNLECGYQCPGICGEVCAEGYCHQCSNKLDARVEFLEMKSYGENVRKSWANTGIHPFNLDVVLSQIPKASSTSTDRPTTPLTAPRPHMSALKPLRIQRQFKSL